MPKEDWIENTIPKIFGREGLWPSQISSVLDAACGVSLKSQYIDCDIRVGVDVYEPYLTKIEADVPYTVIKLDIRDLEKVFIPKSFDCVLLLDVVEHLEKDEALDVLRQAEQIARKCVVVETPLGYIPQNIDIWGHGGDHWQTHRSEWSVEDFTNMQYKVITRPYQMSDVQRHTQITNIDPNITIINAIKLL